MVGHASGTAGEDLARVFVTKPLLRLPSASLATDGKASVHFVRLWVGPCALQLLVNHAGTEDQCICS